MTAPAHILIVDDQEPNRDLLSRHVLRLGATPHLAENGVQALAHVRRQPPDLLLLDINMPEMDGYEVLEQLKADPATRHIPVIVVSAIDDMESIVRCVKHGAEDYLHKPFDGTLLKARINASLEKKRLRDVEQEYRLHLEEKVREQVEAISSAQLGTIFALSKLAESRDTDTGEHLERMREYCRILARRMALLPRCAGVIDREFVENIYAASPLHDIGKVGIPDRILQKPGPLTEEEFTILKTHTLVGATTLRAVDARHPGNSFIRLGIEIAESHHERWDGTGYPRGLAGASIPLVARILALGDVYDALTSKRCYKVAMPPEKAKEIIVAGRGKHFDPDAVDAFLAVEAEFREVRAQFQDLR